MKKYYIVDIFGTERRCSKFEFYVRKGIFIVSIIAGLLIMVGIAIDVIK